MKKFAVRNFVAVIFVILAFAWVWLFFSGQGILVGSEEKEGALADTLDCTYFTGTGLVTKTIIKTDIDAIGSLVCPRIEKVD